MLLIFLCAGIVLALTWLYVRTHKCVKCLERFPGPPTLPLLGNALVFLSSTFSRDLLPILFDYQKQYGDIIKLQVGLIPKILIIQDIKFAEFLLSTTNILDKASEYRYYSKWLGRGLLLSDADARWKQHRKIISKTFRIQILEKFVPVIERTADVLIKKLQSEVGKKSTDIHPFINRCTLDTICETAMGVSVDAQEDLESEYIRSVKYMCMIGFKRVFDVFLQIPLIFYLSGHYRMEKDAIKMLHAHTNEVIARKKAAYAESTVNVINDEDVLGATKKVAFLDLLLQECNMLSDEDVREEVDTLMFAGHDTTTAAISFAMFCLAENLEIQTKAVEELQAIFDDDKNRYYTFSDLNEMKYLEAVIKESLRLYPSVALYARCVREDTEYDGGILPKGVTIIINVFGMHRNPEIFPEPEKFRPERFLSDNITARYPYGYLPFSAGLRNCVGQKFAMIEMKIILSKILMHYELLPTNPRHVPELASETVLISHNGICMRIKERIF